MITDEINAVELAKSDKSYESLAKSISQMLQQRIGITQYKRNGISMYATYCPVEEYEDWTLILTAPKNEFTSAVFFLFLLIYQLQSLF